MRFRNRAILHGATLTIPLAAAVLTLLVTAACGDGEPDVRAEPGPDAGGPDVSQPIDSGADRDANPRPPFDPTPEKVVCASEPCAVQLVAGASHFCVRMSDGTAYCWGDDIWGQLGRGEAATGLTGAGKVVELTDVVDIGAAGNVTCALLADGTPKCWGINADGELGLSADSPAEGGAVFVVVAYGDSGNFTLVGAAIIAGIVIASIATPFAMRRLSGRTLIVVSSVIAAVTYVVMYLAGFENLLALVALIFVTGLMLGVFLVAQTTMSADAVDHAERVTGVRNDGISFATLTFVTKVMSAFSVMAFGVVVVLAGYEKGGEVTAQMQDLVFIGITLVPAASCLLSAVAFLGYRLEQPARSTS